MGILFLICTLAYLFSLHRKSRSGLYLLASGKLVNTGNERFRIKRLQENPGLSAEDAERRIASQMSSDEKRKRADYAIDCSGTLEATRRQVEEVYRQLSRLAKQSGAA